MNLPTISEIKEKFPNKIPENIVGVTFLEGIPPASGLYADSSFIEWIGYWKDMAVGVKKTLFGNTGLAQIVLVGIFKLFTSESVRKPLSEFYDYAATKIVYAEILPAQYVTFGRLPEIPEQEKDRKVYIPIAFSQSVVTTGVSGHWTGLS
jgi:hypothetical protein